MGFYIALLFLTRLPLPQVIFEENQFASAIPFFPMVGIIIGGFLATIQFIGRNFLPVRAMAALLVLFNAAITGGMHLDGFADTMDGLFCGKDRETKLEVMRDSLTGAYGVMGITMVFLLKYAFLSSISDDYILYALVSFPLLSRWMMAFSILFFPYGREKGLGKVFTNYKSPGIYYIVSILVFGVMYLIAGMEGIIVALVTLIMAVIFIRYITAELGGMTGDTYGALNEFCEIIVLLVFVIISNRG